MADTRELLLHEWHVYLWQAIENLRKKNPTNLFVALLNGLILLGFFPAVSLAPSNSVLDQTVCGIHGSPSLRYLSAMKYLIIPQTYSGATNYVVSFSYLWWNLFFEVCAVLTNLDFVFLVNFDMFFLGFLIITEYQYSLLLRLREVVF